MTDPSGAKRALITNPRRKVMRWYRSSRAGMSFFFDRPFFAETADVSPLPENVSSAKTTSLIDWKRFDGDFSIACSTMRSSAGGAEAGRAGGAFFVIAG